MRGIVLALRAKISACVITRSREERKEDGDDHYLCLTHPPPAALPFLHDRNTEKDSLGGGRTGRVLSAGNRNMGT